MHLPTQTWVTNIHPYPGTNAALLKIGTAFPRFLQQDVVWFVAR